MDFEADVSYSFQDLLALNQLAGKTTRKWKNRIVRILLLVVGLLSLVMSALLASIGAFDMGDAPMVVLGLLLLMLAVYHNHFNAWLSRRMLLKGGGQVRYLFGEENFRVVTGSGITEHPYGVVEELYRYRGRFFFFFDKRHGYILPEESFIQGTAEAFLPFIQEKCGQACKTVR